MLNEWKEGEREIGRERAPEKWRTYVRNIENVLEAIGDGKRQISDCYSSH